MAIHGPDGAKGCVGMFWGMFLIGMLLLIGAFWLFMKLISNGV